MTGCQKNLMQIGFALQLYHQGGQKFPTVPTLGGPAGDSPIKAMLDTLALPDFRELNDQGQKPKATGSAPGGVRVPGLACPSDPWAMASPFPSTISYRANAGDTTGGEHGAVRAGQGRHQRGHRGGRRPQLHRRLCRAERRRRYQRRGRAEKLCPITRPRRRGRLPRPGARALAGRRRIFLVRGRLAIDPVQPRPGPRRPPGPASPRTGGRPPWGRPAPTRGGSTSS